jgi:photosystem II stability/assembly factor-like uncharacterized protein
MNSYILSLTLVFCTLFANPSQCQWVLTNMPGGGAIWGLAISGTNLFAGTNVGLFRSADRGVNWTAVNSRFPLLNEWVHPFVAGANLFVGTSGPLFRSTDNGISWTLANSGLPHLGYPDGFTSIDSNLFTVEDGGLYLSTNNGSSWTAINTGFPASNHVYLVAAIGTNLFACTSPAPPGVASQNYGLFRSIDNGASWTAAKGGLPDSAILCYYGWDYPMVQCISAMDTNIFVGTRHKGIYFSTDTGSNWTAVNSGLTNYGNLQFSGLAVIGTNIFAVAFADTGRGGKFCHVFHSTNNGAYWTEVNAGIPANTYVGSFTASGPDLFAGGGIGNYNGGIIKSTDNGTSWTAINSGLTGYRVNVLVLNDTNLIAGTDIGAFLSSDNGTSWTTINSGFTATATNPITSLATIGPNIVAGTEGNDTSAGIYYSADNGKSWNTSYSEKTPGNQTWVFSIAVSGTTIFAGTNFYVLRSIDSGVTWTSVADTGAFSLAVMGTNIFAGSNQLGVIRSIDNGTTWINASSGLPDTLQAGWGMFIYSLAVQGTNLFAGTGNEVRDGDGIFLSTDSGTSWTAVNTGLPANAYISCLSVSGHQVFAATDTSGVFVSSDTGRSWAAVNSGLPDDISVRSIVASGTETPIGLPKTQANSSAKNGHQLFAGTYNRGIWRLPLSTAHALGNPIKSNVDQRPKIHSNLMHGRSAISYTITSSCFVTLSLYSISGKLLSTIINKAQSPGKYTAAISHNVAAGFYVLKFKAGNYELTNKLLLQ